MDALSAIELTLAAAANAVIVPDNLTASGPGSVRATSPENVLAARPAKALFMMPAGYVPFSVGSPGNFPYYWQDPANLRFNAKTYSWIAAGLKAGANPVQLDGVFTNRFIRVLSSIVFTLSTADQARLTQGQRIATDDQRELLLAWMSAFGALPSDAAGSPPINLLMEEIVGTWAYPATDLNKILAATDASVLLNKAPPAAQTVLPALQRYLTTIRSSVPLMNQVTKNNGLLKRALAALRTPAPENGALILSDGSLVPAFSVQPPVSDILSGLSAQGTDRTVRLELAVTPRGDGTHSVSVNGGPPVSGVAAGILTFEPDGSGDLLGSALSASGAQSMITADFAGVTTVSFAPAEFSTETLKNWFWTEPITQAIKNGTSDVSGFRFAPIPPFDFSNHGQFGCLTSVIISRNPSIKVVLGQPPANPIVDVLNNHPGAKLSFLGRSLGALGEREGYTATAGIGAAGQTTLQLEASTIAGINVEARAFVLGVKTLFAGQ